MNSWNVPGQSDARGAIRNLAKTNIIFVLATRFRGGARVPARLVFRHVFIATFDAPIPTCVRAAVCASPPVEAPHGLPSCRDLENEKSASYSHTYPFLSCQNYFFRNVSPIYHLRTYTYMPATGFLWTCHICF